MARSEVEAKDRAGRSILDAEGKPTFCGHVPGAVNIPYEENWVDPGTPGKLARREVANNRGLSLKSDADLRKLYSRLDANKETVVYCQSGVRAAETAAVLDKLGFRNVKVYNSSWLGYASKLDAPVENEVFFNVGALSAQLTAMQSKIDALEKALAAMRAWSRSKAARTLDRAGTGLRRT